MGRLGVVLLLLGLAGHLAAADKLWVGGSSSDWFDDANWQPPGAPSSADSISITNPTSILITGDLAIASLELRRATLVVSNQLTVTNLLVSDGCRLSAWLTRPSPIINSPPNSGVIEVPASGTLQIGVGSSTASGLTIEGARLNLRGSAFCTNRVSILLFYRSEFNVYGTLTLLDEVNFDGANGPPSGSLNNYGLVQRPSGTNLTFASVGLTNRGTIWHQSGTMTIGDGINGGLMNISFSATQSFIGAPFQWQAGGSIIGGGTVRLTRGSFDLGTNTLTIPHLHAAGGTLIVSNLVRVSEGDWEAGTLSGPGQLIAAAGGHFSMKVATIIDSQIISQGKFAFRSNALVRFAGNASLVNQSVIELGNGANVYANDPPFSPPPWYILNQWILASDPNTTNSIAMRLTNAGTLRVLGNLRLVDAIQTSGSTEVSGVLRVPSGYVIGGGVLSGTGTISGTIRSAAITTPGSSIGQLTVQGSFTNKGAIDIELGSASDVPMSDLLSVTNHLRLGGSLAVCYVGNGWPPSGTSWEVLRFGSSSGSFATIEGLDLGGGHVLQPVFSPTNLVLVLSNQNVQSNVFALARCLPGQIELRFTGEPLQNYSIDVSSNLINWSPLLVTNSLDGVIYLRDSFASPRRFFRARQISGP